jgi:polyvinyl alcohol dehydrogenase (cytochrome)
MKILKLISVMLINAGWSLASIAAQSVDITTVVIPDTQGAEVFLRDCAACHKTAEEMAAAEDADLESVRAPTLEILQTLAPSAIFTSLTRGKMIVQGSALTEAQQIAVSQYLTGRTMSADPVNFPDVQCPITPSLSESLSRPGWIGWGNGLGNNRFQPAEAANLSVADIPQLELAWAFGFRNTSSARTQPVIMGNWLFTAGENGEVYALDAQTGCTHWIFQADAAVRTAISVATVERSGSDSNHLLFFGDGSANAYALNAQTGALLWSRKIDEHPNSSITGAPAIYDGIVYFPVSAAGEEVRGPNPDYECCTFRGSVSALNMLTGEPVWKTFSIAQEPQPRGVSANDVRLYGPAGAGIWNSPTIDADRGVLYVGTGNGFAEPQPATTDAVIALDLYTGAMRWVQQTTPNDVWLWQCESEANINNPNCPGVQGPDFDFGASPMLTSTSSGRDLIIATQKSGMVYAMDPDQGGTLVWEFRIGAGSDLGGQWGAATDGEKIYVGVADTLSPSPGGLHAIDLETGVQQWFAPPRPTLCEGGAEQQCFPAQGSATTVIPGAVFSGGSDGGLRAYATENGELLWEYNTNRLFETVNGVAASGATIDAAGPVVVDGMVYVNSGYTGIVGRGGNVLLAFRVAEGE